MKYPDKNRIFLILIISTSGFLFLSGLLKNHFLANSQIVYARDASSGQTQVENFNQDLNKAEDYWVHNRLGREYDDLGNYEKAIEEYKKAIEIIQSAPGDDWPNLKKEDADRINQESKNDSQIFSRYRLSKVYEKAGRYQESIEQIDWLLAHKPLDHVKQELLAKKAQLQPSLSARAQTSQAQNT